MLIVRFSFHWDNRILDRAHHIITEGEVARAALAPFERLPPFSHGPWKISVFGVMNFKKSYQNGGFISNLAGATTRN